MATEQIWNYRKIKEALMTSQQANNQCCYIGCEIDVNILGSVNFLSDFVLQMTIDMEERRPRNRRAN